MYCRLYCAVVFCLFFATTSSLQCYTGTDEQCLLSRDVSDCGQGERCQCAKYRFQCSTGDGACTKKEQSAKTTKWAYTMVTQDTCTTIKKYPTIYSNLTCCSTNKCNRPDSGKCSWSHSRRQALRRLTDLFDNE